MLLGAALLAAATLPAVAADDILDAIDQARKAYTSGDMGSAKQSLDLASQLIGQKNAEGFAALLPKPLPGWKAGEVQTQALGQLLYTQYFYLFQAAGMVLLVAMIGAIVLTHRERVGVKR